MHFLRIKQRTQGLVLLRINYLRYRRCYVSYGYYRTAAAAAEGVLLSSVFFFVAEGFVDEHNFGVHGVDHFMICEEALRRIVPVRIYDRAWVPPLACMLHAPCLLLSCGAVSYVLAQLQAAAAVCVHGRHIISHINLLPVCPSPST